MVYKGMLLNNLIVNIKRSREITQQEIEDFINELAVQFQVNHQNVV